ncbi:MAG: roadblock/LC7 domain-containing protein [Planctomycetota bacterium]
MKEILHRLDGAAGVRASLLMTRDGVVAATSRADGEASERVAALASAVLRHLDRGLDDLIGKGPTRVTLAARRGRILFVPLGDFVLVIIADRDTDLEFTLMEIAGLAGRLARVGRICA